MLLNRQYIIAVDGGGTRTRAVVGTKEGEVLAVVEGANKYEGDTTKRGKDTD